MAAFHQEASKLCQCHCHRGGVDTTCGTPSAAQTSNRTPTKTNNEGIGSLSYPLVEASTGQVEIKSITPDQGDVKGLVTNQSHVNQGTVQKLDQKDVKVVIPDQGVVKDPTSDHKKIKGQICCDNISSCDSHDHQNVINAPPAVKSENQGEVIDLSKVDNDDDDDFKPPKKKYRVVGVC